MISLFAYSQTNTAVASGSIGKCAVWDYPYTLYNSAGASQTVSPGVTVTVDQDRSIGAVNLSGSGALALSGANGITLSGAGSETTCRWDIPLSKTANVYYGPNGGTVYELTSAGFSAPFTGNFIWVRSTGWSTAHSGTYSVGQLRLFNFTSNQSYPLYSRNEAGSCPAYQDPDWPVGPATWSDPVYLSMTAGNSLYYLARIPNTATACRGARMDYTLGNAFLLYNN